MLAADRILLLALCAAPLAAQNATAAELAEREQKLHTSAVQVLLSYARSAESNKLPSRAVAAYELVLAHYDAENKIAKAALAKAKGAADQGTAAQRRSTDQGWTLAGKKLAPQHRDLGIALLAIDDLLRGQHHLELALRYDPSDLEAHKALGHAEHNGFFGTDDEIAFCKRLAAIESRAKELGATGYQPAALPADKMPEELRRSGLSLAGAKTRSFAIWTTSESAEPDTAAPAEMAEWGERAIALLEFTLGSAPARHAQVAIQARRNRWIAVVRSAEQWTAFFAANPQILEKAKLQSVPPQSNFAFESSTGQAEIFLHRRELDADSMIAHVTMWGFATDGNEGLGQGLVHTMTSLLVGTMNTWFGSPPPTQASPRKELPRDPKQWAARIREEIAKGADWPAVQVPRERLSSFRENVRVKSWSFVYWLMARYPDRWTRAFKGLESEKNPMPEAIEAFFAKEFERSLSELEQEWRQWAGGNSAIAKATGHSG
ncbi:MAG: hypothetical protein IT456_11595 [Planctomycetes bacterium]|nr:hypothetical protein [Planctomycetota bacterium]